MSLAERLDKIRSQPRLQNQQQTAVVLAAVEDTLKDQTTEITPAAYFAALLSLLGQHISTANGIVNKDVATAVVYLLDLVTPHVAAPLLRSKFTQILTSLAPALTHPDAEAPLLRASIGVLESLLVAQDAAAWALPAAQPSPRRAVQGLLAIAVDHRPKVRKRALEALAKVLNNPPPSPSLDHPAADMCAESALHSLRDIAEQAAKARKQKSHRDGQQHDPALIHALQLIKTIAKASKGWPSHKIEPLCELLLGIAKSSNEFLTMAAFEVFEVIFEGMANEVSASTKLPRLLEVISELQPSKNDSQLLPPWIAVLSRGYDVAAQVDAEETFQKLPDLFVMISGFLASPSHNIRVSASECLISFMANCIPPNVILDPSIFEEKTLEKLATAAKDLLSLKYQAAWMEVFNVLGSMFEVLRWRSAPLLSPVVKTIGDLRGNDSFTGKKEADAVLSQAIRAMGPDKVLEILPLNLVKPAPGQPGRAWLLPLLRDSVTNTYLAHFRSELVPVSEAMFQRVLDHGDAPKTMEIKIYETVVNQIWSILPGYCDLPLDLVDAFDQSFAELIANLLYQKTDLRTDLCKALENLVDTNAAIVALPGDDDLLAQSRVSKAQAKKNLDHLAKFASNLLAVLFNVYSQTLPQYRGTILRCINAYLSITPAQELMETFGRVATALESSLTEAGPQTQADKQKQKKTEDKMPPMSHTLMDLVITLSIYLPRDSFGALFNMATIIINKDDDPQLQKKAYKLIPRLAESETGKAALKERNTELQQLLLASAEKAGAPARRDRLAAIAQVIEYLPAEDLHFIPSILPEVIISAKEVNEKARTAAFDLLVSMGEKMQQGGVVVNSKVSNMPDDAPSVPANLEEYFTMVSAGLAGSTPHMISASITAITRILYTFYSSISTETITNLLDIMDMFLQNPNREIVRSVLGFVKVAIISLPTELVEPRLKTLIPHLMVWSHEHKAHFKAKVKHIIERMMRRYGIAVVERYCPEEDKKLITNIRKTRERNKRKKEAAAENGEEVQTKPKGKFESEFDQAVYGSESESEGSDVSDDELMAEKGGKKRGKAGEGKQYIIEDEDEPLDLLDRRALGHISSTKPTKGRQAAQADKKKTNAKTDIDGKLVIGVSDDEDDEAMLDVDEGGSLEAGINAYVSAIKGRDAAQRGQRGKLKFSNKKGKGGDDDEGDDDEMEVDAAELKSKMKSQQQRGGPKSQRKPLGAEKTKGGRVGKSPRGGGGGGRPRGRSTMGHGRR